MRKSVCQPLTEPYLPNVCLTCYKAIQTLCLSSCREPYWNGVCLDIKKTECLWPCNSVPDLKPYRYCVHMSIRDPYWYNVHLHLTVLLMYILSAWNRVILHSASPYCRAILTRYLSLLSIVFLSFNEPYLNGECIPVTDYTDNMSLSLVKVHTNTVSVIT